MGIDGVMLATLLQAPPLTPAAARAVRERLLQTEPALQEALPLAPEAGPAISIVPVLCLYLTREPVERRRAHGGVPEVPLARLRFAYGPVQVAISAPDETIFAVADGQALAYRRHLETEQRALVTLRQAGLFPPPPGPRVQELRPGPAQGDDWVLDRDSVSLPPRPRITRFILETVQSLRVGGWQISLDPRFPVQTVLDISPWYAEVSGRAVARQEGAGGENAGTCMRATTGSAWN
ncbi:MAG: hypothetical protein FD153_451 [Rhodospirillaceae bacterium]|nr:MAG: hypothetical protein FD153_451 [Rhodospirillaceae bacterium]